MAAADFETTVFQAILKHAREEYPAECCGWVIADSSGRQTYFPSENLQEKYHKLDPETYPRTAAEAFLIDALKLSRATDAAQDAGGCLYSVVHSHIDVGAYFSGEDKKQMALPDGSGPVYPAVNYLVVGVNTTGFDSFAAYQYEDGEFVEIAVRVNGGDPASAVPVHN